MNTPLSEQRYDVAIIGAGVAGSYCAERLHSAGLNVCVIDKSRGTGGRASSKRLAANSSDQSVSQSCELGAPFFHLEDQQLASSIHRWLAACVIAPWPAADQHDQIAYTGTPTMSALTRHMIKGCDFYGNEKISIIESDHQGWRLLNESYQCRLWAKQLIITAPAAQSAVLLSGSDAPETWLLDAHRATLACSPQWASVVTLTDTCNTMMSPLELDCLKGLPSVIELDNEPIARIICDGDKPQRTPLQSRWVLQADQDWSQQHIDAEAQWVSEQLLSCFIVWLNKRQDYVFAAKDFSLLPAHRWRLGRHHAFLSADMALTADSNNRSKMSLDYRWSQSLGVAVAADWLGEGSVYAAMKSADNLVNAMLAST